MERKARGWKVASLTARWRPVRDLDDYTVAAVVPSFHLHSVSPSDLSEKQEQQDSAPQPPTLASIPDS
jgi:hypothetical protein